MTPARFRWGMLLILIGILFLLHNFGEIEIEFLVDTVVYLAFFLIAIGIEKMFTGTRLEFLSYLSTVAFAAVMVYFAISWSGGDYFSTTTISEEYDPSIQKMTAEVRLGSSDLTVRDATDKLIYGRFREWTRKPVIDYSYTDNAVEVVLKRTSWSPLGKFVTIDRDEPDDWKIAFCDQIPLYLECHGDRSDIHLNLSTTPLRELSLDADDAVVYLKLGDLLPQVKVDLRGEDTKVRLRVPRDAGLRVSGSDHDRLLRRIGLIKQNGYFVNDGYENSPSKIEIDLDDRFRSLSIDFY
ncbi:MAG: hypothetical protein JSU65_09825 [Candidatus Zixiibacteriota bacterium]|nr:MAG: hypothetical protein JSU65_09825 [candidate division Zixibacteria bacterium]